MSRTTPRRMLTVDRIYDEPDLVGVAFGNVRWRPHSSSLSYTKSNAVGGERKTELWAFDVKKKRGELLFDYAPLKGAVDTGPLFLHPHPRVLPDVVPICHWLPGGDKLIVAVSGRAPRLLDLASGALQPLISDAVPIRQMKVSPNGRFVSVVCGYDLYLIEITTGRWTPITSGSTDAHRSASPDSMDELVDDGHWWSPDSKRIAYMQTDESAVPVFWYANLLSTKGENIAERYPHAGDPHPVAVLRVASHLGHVTIDTRPWPGYYLARVSWLPDSQRLALQMVSPEQKKLCLVLADASTGTTRCILTETDEAWINVTNDLRFFEDGRRFLWSSERESYRHLYLYDIDGTEQAQLTSGPEACVAVQGLDEKNGHVYYSVFPKPHTDGHLKRVTFDGETLELTTEPGTHLTNSLPDFEYFVDSFSTAVQPPRLDLYRTDGTFVTTIEENPCRELAEFQLSNFKFPAVPAASEFGQAADVPLYSKLLEPSDREKGRKYPVIVYVYGGPSPAGNGMACNVWSSWFPGRGLWPHVMAQEGFGVFSLDNRGSNAAPRGHAWETPIHRRLGQVELADQLEGVKYLKSLDWVDPERIGILGGSFGGFMTLNAMLREPAVGTFKAAVTFAPVTDWKQYSAEYAERYMDLPDRNPGGYEETALCQYAKNLRGKLLLIHGALDPNVHVQHSIELIDALILADKDFEMMLYPRQVHLSFFGTGQGPARLWTRITDFFKTNL